MTDLLTTTEEVLEWAQDCEPRESPYGDHRREQWEARLAADRLQAEELARANRLLQVYRDHVRNCPGNQVAACDAEPAFWDAARREVGE